MADINVTPFVDVMLVLLIIFMVAAPLMMVGVPVELPRTSAAKLSQPRKPVIVSVSKDGKVFVGEEEAPAAELPSRLAALRSKDPGATVYVRGDRSIPYGRVMEVMGPPASQPADAPQWRYDGVLVSFDGFDEVERFVVFRR